jgi:non-specific serine/threonine protein kinase
LAVFAGGWTAEAAEAICAGDGISALDVLTELRVLVNVSLARRLDETGEEPRFDMLHTTREYALEQLGVAGEATLVARRHFEWYVALAESVAPFEPSAEQIEHLEREQDNLRAALRWSIEAREMVPGQMALRLGVALYPLWYRRGQYSEGRAWLAELLALPGAATRTALRAQALAWAGHFASVQGALVDAELLLREGLATAQEVGGALVQSICWQTLGSVYRRRGALFEAEAAYKQSLEFAQIAQNPIQAAWAVYMAAFTRYELDDADAVRAAVSGAVKRNAADTYPRVRGRIFRLQAWLAARDGDYALALAFEEQALALLGWLGDQQGLAFGNLEAARRALDLGDRPRAAGHLAAAVAIGRATGDQQALAQGLEGVAQLVATSQPGRAAYLVGAATEARQTYGLSRPPVDQTWLESWFPDVRRSLSDAASELAWENGRRASLERVIDLAKELADSVPP